MPEIAEIKVQLVAIKTTLDRVLNHQTEFKEDMKDIKSCVHAMDIKIIEGDNEVREECKKRNDKCKEENNALVKNLAYGSVYLIVVLISAILGFLAYHNGN